jgi:hypothetical protein
MISKEYNKIEIFFFFLNVLKFKIKNSKIIINSLKEYDFIDSIYCTSEKKIS